MMFKEYYLLAKPNMVYGNLLTTVAGALYASRWHFAAQPFFAVLVGLGFVIGGACVFNNCIDRGIDTKMARTSARGLAMKRVSLVGALIYGSTLSVAGFLALLFLVNPLTMLAALFGFVFYTVFYSIAKRASYWGVVVGSVSGSVPILVGYTAFADRLDLSALILFLAMALWQMPHFYAISVYRLKEYAAAGIPLLPAKKGMYSTKVYMLSYIVAFFLCAAALVPLEAAGYTYLVVITAASLYWFWRTWQGFHVADESRWARSLFFVSLWVLLAFSLGVSAAPVLP